MFIFQSASPLEISRKTRDRPFLVERGGGGTWSLGETGVRCDSVTPSDVVKMYKSYKSKFELSPDMNYGRYNLNGGDKISILKYFTKNFAAQRLRKTDFWKA